MIESFLTEQERILRNKLERYLQSEETHASLKRRVAIPFIRAALLRMEKGTYGICVDCEDPIALARLETVPGAIRCTECQKEADRG